MVQVSLIGYAIGGAFLSLAYLDLPYYIMGLVVQCLALVDDRAAGKPAPVQAAARGPAMDGVKAGRP